MKPAQPLRIVQVFRAPLGGLFRHVMDLTRGQIAAGHQVGVVCASCAGGQREADILNALAPDLALGLHRFPMARTPGPRDLMALRTFRAIVREARPDILHGHGAKGGLYARLPRMFDRRWPATCYTPHGGSFNYFPGTLSYHLFMSVEETLKKRTDLLLMESNYIADRIARALGDLPPFKVVPNGISPEEFEPVVRSPGAADLLFVGELRLLKGVDTLIDALALIHAGGQKPTLKIQGSGPDEAMLKARVARHGLEHAVTFLPPGPVRPAFAAARIMVVPSRAESLPYIILEAAAARIPLVSTHVGGIPEIFGPFADRLISPEDPAVLADALRTALARDDATLNREAAELAAYVGERFSMSSMVDSIVAGYTAALAHRRGEKLPESAI